jgi:hypothetical protein
MRWTTRELEYVDIFAVSISFGVCSYYRACHLLGEVIGGRTYEAIRTKLKQRVKSFEEGSGLA